MCEDGQESDAGWLQHGAYALLHLPHPPACAHTWHNPSTRSGSHGTGIVESWGWLRRSPLHRVVPGGGLGGRGDGLLRAPPPQRHIQHPAGLLPMFGQGSRSMLRAYIDPAAWPCTARHPPLWRSGHTPQPPTPPPRPTSRCISQEGPWGATRKSDGTGGGGG